MISPAQEVALGERALERFLESHRLSTDGTLLLRVDRIGRKVARVSDHRNRHYRFLVVEGSEPQAYSFLGGTVCVTDTLARLHSVDDELAFTLGHELAHIALRHQVSQLRMQGALRTGAPGDDALVDAVTSVFGGDAEIEADRFGALYAVRAGFKYTSTYAALDRVGKATTPQQDRVHPRFESRVAALKDFRRELERSLKAFDRGVAALRARNSEDAISMLALFVGQFPNSVAGRVNLGAAYLERVRQDAGTPAGLSQVLPVLSDPGILVRSVVNVVDLNLARDNFESALDIQPDEVVAMAGLGLIHARLGEFQKARTQLNEARGLAPDRADLVLCLGNVEYMARNYPEARSLYLQSLGLQPDWPEARKNLAMTYEKLGEFQQARESWSSLTSHGRLGSEAKRHIDDLISESD